MHRAYGVALFEGVFQTSERTVLANGTRVPLKMLKIRFRDGTMDVLPRAAGKELKLFKRREEVGEYGTVRLDGMRSNRSWQKRKERAAREAE